MLSYNILRSRYMCNMYNINIESITVIPICNYNNATTYYEYCGKYQRKYCEQFCRNGCNNNKFNNICQWIDKPTSICQWIDKPTSICRWIDQPKDICLYRKY